VTDYKVFLKQTKNGPEDWDICVAVQFKNWAALDGATAKTEAVRDKILGGKAQAQFPGREARGDPGRLSVRSCCRRLC